MYVIKVSQRKIENKKLKNFSKNFVQTLDNKQKIWYNKYTKKKR